MFYYIGMISEINTRINDDFDVSYGRKQDITHYINNIYNREHKIYCTKTNDQLIKIIQLILNDKCFLKNVFINNGKSILSLDQICNENYVVIKDKNMNNLYIWDWKIKNFCSILYEDILIGKDEESRQLLPLLPNIIKYDQILDIMKRDFK